MSEKIKKHGRVCGLLCWLLALLYFTSYITRLNFSAAMAEMIARGVLTKPQAGTIGTALFFSYGFGQIISGMLGDRFRPNRIISTGLFLSILCNICMPMVGNPWLMTLVWGVNGLSQAMFWPPIVKLMATYLDAEEYVTCNWMVMTGAHTATILVYLEVPACIKFLDWRWAFFVSAIWAFCYFIAFNAGFACIRKNEKVLLEHVAERESGKSASEAVSTEAYDEAEKRKGAVARKFLFSAPFVMILVATALHGFLKDGVQSWMPTFITEVFAMEASTAILSNIVLPVFNIFVVSLATMLYKKVFKNETLEAMAFYGGTILLSLLLVMFLESSAWVCLLLAALITGSMHGINLMFISFLPRRFTSSGKVATVSGICNACVYVGSAISSYGIAMIAEKLGWRATVLSWAAIGLLGFVLCLLALRPWMAFTKQVD